jgi:hypothetical protein
MSKRLRVACCDGADGVYVGCSEDSFPAAWDETSVRWQVEMVKDSP